MNYNKHVTVDSNQSANFYNPVVKLDPQSRIQVKMELEKIMFHNLVVRVVENFSVDRARTALQRLEKQLSLLLEPRELKCRELKCSHGKILETSILLDGRGVGVEITKQKIKRLTQITWKIHKVGEILDQRILGFETELAFKIEPILRKMKQLRCDIFDSVPKYKYILFEQLNHHQPYSLEIRPSFSKGIHVFTRTIEDIYPKDSQICGIIFRILQKIMRNDEYRVHYNSGDKMIKPVLDPNRFGMSITPNMFLKNKNGFLRA
jgi:hypothetical protein